MAEPELLVTFTSTLPGIWAGVTTLILLAVLELILALTPPKLTEVTLLKLIPVIVRLWPPRTEPAVIESLEILGEEEFGGGDVCSVVEVVEEDVGKVFWVVDVVEVDVGRVFWVVEVVEVVEVLEVDEVVEGVVTTTTSSGGMH